MVEMGGGQLLGEGLEACRGMVDRALPAPCAELRSVSDGVRDGGMDGHPAFTPGPMRTSGYTARLPTQPRFTTFRRPGRGGGGTQSAPMAELSGFRRAAWVFRFD